MSSIIGSIFGTQADKSADETIGINAMLGAAALSTAYLTATLEATTPEVRRLFSEYTTQNVLGHEALMALALKKGWIKPYDAPVQQLGDTFQESQGVVEG